MRIENEIITRNPHKDEMPVLQNMWKAVFGEEGKDSFFKHLYATERAIIVESDGKPAAMGHLIPMGELLLCGKVPLNCAMLYAIAVLPGQRGMGFGAAVTNALISAAFKSGYPAAVLSPADDGLFDYYSRRTQLREWFYTERKTILEQPGIQIPQRSASITSAPAHQMQEVTPVQYGTLREALLEGVVHVRHSLECLEYQKLLCTELGGGLYRIGDSCAVIETQPGGAVLVKELLTADSNDEGTVIAAITESFRPGEIICRVTAKCGQGDRFGMLVASEDIYDYSDSNGMAPWYGLAFD